MSILAIDDDLAIVRFLTRLLKRTLPESTVLTAPNGIRGVQLALEHRTTLQLIILDARMPSLDGQFVAAFLRCACPTVPIMALSGDSCTHDTFQALGCLPSLTKGSPAAIYQQAIMQALQTPVTAPTMTPLHRAMAEQAALLIAAGETHVVVERQTLQRLASSLDGLARRVIVNRALTQSMKELRRLM
jgi:CheY-like chemotaxis protein